MNHCLRSGHHCHADVISIDERQLFGGRLPRLPRPSAQMYQSDLGFVRVVRDCRNHGC